MWVSIIEGKKQHQKIWEHLKCLTKKWFYKLLHIYNVLSHVHHFLIRFFNSIGKYDTALSEQNRT